MRSDNLVNPKGPDEAVATADALTYRASNVTVNTGDMARLIPGDLLQLTDATVSVEVCDERRGRPVVRSGSRVTISGVLADDAVLRVRLANAGADPE